MGSLVTTVRHRIYADFLMPARLDEYRRLLEAFLRAGYAVVSIETFWDLLTSTEVDDARRYLILRHDIDTDPATGRRMWEIERDLGVQGSFFFRLSTFDVGLMQAIARSGSAASYHYEELATMAKRERMRSRDQVVAGVGDAQRAFRHNLAALRARTGLPMTVVASHGDFVNRRFGVPNWVMLDDPGFRKETGIELEAYDDAFMTHVTSRHADTLHPAYWVPASPVRALERADPVVYLLVHPRHWRTSRILNARDDMNRLAESAWFRVPRWGRPGRETDKARR